MKYEIIQASVVTSHKSNTCSVFAFEACVYADLLVSVVTCLCDQIYAKDAKMEKVFHLCDVTTAPWVKL